MCGRFALYSPYPKLSESLRLPLEAGKVTPRYNVAPGTFVTAVRRADDEAPLVMDKLWWGYRPHWAKGKGKGEAPQSINATVEKVATSNYFKGAFRQHRCLIPADGWYEWLPVDGKKQPHFLTRTDGEPIWLAGIWAQRADGTPGCAIITEPARGTAKEIHSRMPLLLDADSLAPWLDPDLTERETIRNVVHHLDAELITHWAVSTRVNPPGNDSNAALINPA
ncbi:SOS response-associated peptidase [Halomonas sp. TRM85114]|uniref:SOS response-associated peptidase n=1 Tax=Halomonas jincaotanensis TaxID=2810616 RepID=UPI001BD24FB9|nr:SOS response-associated peptidase [Halomonas jincaotanensis]MBS9405661.1 SOS response-associated peptidase [Halomonas jincaotanensis]